MDQPEQLPFLFEAAPASNGAQPEGCQSPAGSLNGTAPASVEEEIRRPTRDEDECQQYLFGGDDESWREHWWGMPSFDMGDARPVQRITLNFQTLEDVREFGQRLELNISRQTTSLWFPPIPKVCRDDYVYDNEP